MMDRAVILVVCLTGFVGWIVGGVHSQSSDYFFFFFFSFLVGVSTLMFPNLLTWF